MRRLAAGTAVVGLLAFASLAVAQVGLPWPGPGTPASAGASFTGVGDTLSGAKAHYGVVAYSSAQRGQKMLKLCNGGVCADVNSDASTGLVSNAPTINSAACDNSGHVCKVDTAYDDSGANQCTGAACDRQQTTDATRPTFVTSCNGSLPCIKCSGSQALPNVGGPSLTSMSQPISMLASMNTTVSGLGSIIGLGIGLIQFGMDTGFKVFYYASAVLDSSATTTSGTFIAAIGTQPAAGSTGTSALNGSATSGSIGSQASSGTVLQICEGSSGSNRFTGELIELAVYNADISGNTAALTTTMRANGGY